MNELSMLRIEWAKLCLKNSSEKVKSLKQNLGHNKIVITGKQRHYFQISKNLWSILRQNKPNLVPNKHPEV